MSPEQKKEKINKYSNYLKDLIKYGNEILGLCEKKYKELQELKENFDANKVNEAIKGLEELENELRTPRFKNSYSACETTISSFVISDTAVSTQAQIDDEQKASLLLTLKLDLLFKVIGFITLTNENIQKHSANWIK